MNKMTSTTGTLLGVWIALAALPKEEAHAKEQTAVIQGLSISDSTRVQMLTAKDGSTNIGRIVGIGEDNVQFETAFGTVAIPIAEIDELSEVSQSSLRNGRYWFANPNATRLYFAPTGRMLKRGQGYFSDYYLFFPGVAYGVTDHITIGGGISLFPYMDQMLYFSPKVGSTVAKNLNVAAGALFVKVPHESSLVRILYGVATYGTADNSITAGLGYGSVDGDLAENPMLMLGGEKRISRRMAFVTENWMFAKVDQPVISYGIRFFGQALSVDLAFFTPMGEDAFFPGVPYIDFVFNF